ncbi:MAG: hypothetical protein H0V12_00145 [Chloroflexi bacterium]|nr:hypothetical protein [Chloroflexota bacterium]
MRLGADRAFAPAAALLAHVTGVAMSPATLRRLTLAAGTTMRQLASGDTVWADGAAAAEGPLQLSVDGSMVQLHAEGWREVKLAAIGKRAAAGPLTAPSSTATLGDAATFGHEALGELARRGVPWATDVVAVNDGAAWIQGFLDLHCPQAGRVLDVAHAAGYLAPAAHAAYGAGTPAAQRWFATQRHEVRHGDPDRMLAALAALPLSAERDQAIAYLTARRDQIAYRDVVARGWPIGSGCVESAHTGMRWSRAGAQGMLALRLVGANARWADRWSQVLGHQRAARRGTVAPRRAARPRLVQDGRPTADHPW